MKLPERFTNYFILINQYLEQAIPAAAVPPKPIYEAMRYSVFAVAKPFRRFLPLVMGEGFGPEPEVPLRVQVRFKITPRNLLFHIVFPGMKKNNFAEAKP